MRRVAVLFCAGRTIVYAQGAQLLGHRQMVLYESFERRLEDVTNRVATLFRGCGKLVAVVVGDAADEVDLFDCQCVGRLFAVAFDVRHFTFEWVDIATEKLGEAVDEKGVDSWMFPMACAERTQRGEIAVGEGSAVDALDDVGLGFVRFVKENLADVGRQLLLEDVADQAFADAGSTAFVAQDVAKGRNAGVQPLAVVVAGIAARAENADGAGIVSARTSCRTQHIAFHMNLSGGADRVFEASSHDGGFFGGATGTIEIDGGQRLIVNDSMELGHQFLAEHITDGLLVLLEGVDALGVDDAPLLCHTPCGFGRTAIRY